MKKIILACISLGLWCPSLIAQRFISETGKVSFFSETALEDIKADNTQVTSLLDVGTKQIVFSIPIKAFAFEKSLMQEHFNESYLESDKYPKSTFTGIVSGFDPKGGKQHVTATGDLFMHGVKRKVTVEGTMELVNGKWMLHTQFPVTAVLKIVY